ncbi:unnamed protein product [Ambrosiozyma monospora]|uniref:Unnamed protein product n=1 Tax=Ambrosiozyma monospora TaxID=43982 RepID=A0ACB5T550_AMBMO|nr:unnamed protein product [Ambrosiozyma monospora]
MSGKLGMGPCQCFDRGRLLKNSTKKNIQKKQKGQNDGELRTTNRTQVHKPDLETPQISKIKINQNWISLEFELECAYLEKSNVLEEIDDLFAIVGLVGYNPQLDQIVQLYFNSQDILFDFDTVLPSRDESERKWVLQLITKFTTTPNKTREIDTTRSKPSHSPITYQVLKAYCCLMYQHDLRFNSITIGSHIPYSSVDQMRVYPEYELLLELSREIKLECNHNAFLKSLSLYSMDWLYDVTSLKVSKFFIQLDAINRFPNLNELTIDAGHLN